MGNFEGDTHFLQAQAKLFKIEPIIYKAIKSLKGNRIFSFEKPPMSQSGLYKKSKADPGNFYLLCRNIWLAEPETHVLLTPSEPSRPGRTVLFTSPKGMPSLEIFILIRFCVSAPRVSTLVTRPRSLQDQSSERNCPHVEGISGPNQNIVSVTQ